MLAWDNRSHLIGKKSYWSSTHTLYKILKGNISNKTEALIGIASCFISACMAFILS